jgi:hypothetical protein
MPPRRTKNPDLIDHVMKTPSGAYKYARRVPKALQAVIGRAVWDFSLGSEINAAIARAQVYTAEHDTLIATLSSPEGREKMSRRRELDAGAATLALPLTLAREASKSDASEGLKLAADAAASQIAPGLHIDVAAPVWRRTEEMMQQARALPASAERDKLAMFAAYAFGDRSYLETQAVDDPFGDILVENLHPTRPVDKTGSMFWDAYKAALDARLAELAPETRVDTSLCIKELMEVYAATKRPQTRRAYVDKIRRLTDAQGNHPPAYYTKDRLQEHRDLLLKEGVAAPTIAKHFETFKTLWRWAAREKSALAGLTFPDIVMPDITTTVEDTRWQAFDDDQIKKVWGLLNDAWGPESDSGLSPSRRAAFLMGFRVLLHTGMRPVELFFLGPDSAKNGELHIKYTKTATARRIPLAAALSDLPDFLAAGGFAAELEAGKTAIRQGKVYGQATKPDSIARAFTTAFSTVIRAGGLTNDRHVLYSAKDTLVDRLQRQGATDDVIRGIIGHVGGQGKLRHYKTPLGQSPHGMAQMRKALDAIEYW